MKAYFVRLHGALKGKLGRLLCQPLRLQTSLLRRLQGARSSCRPSSACGSARPLRPRGSSRGQPTAAPALRRHLAYGSNVLVALELAAVRGEAARELEVPRCDGSLGREHATRPCCSSGPWRCLKSLTSPSTASPAGSRPQPGPGRRRVRRRRTGTPSLQRRRRGCRTGHGAHERTHRKTAAASFDFEERERFD